MDNAAKALVIAGGILIGMLIITLAMYMYTSFQDTYEKSMQIHSNVEINAFNTYFTRYGFVSGDPNITYVSGADAYNILSRAYEVSNDEDAIVDKIEVVGDVFSIDKQNGGNKFYERMFYYSDTYSKLFQYQYYYNNEGIIYKVSIK